MKVSLWRAEEHLGEADLSDVPGVSVRRAALRGPFKPAAGFAAVWPLFAEYQRCGVQFVTAFQSLPPDTTPDAMPAALSAVLPEAALSILSRAQGAIAALGLELRDERGRALSGADVQLSSWQLFDAAALGDMARSAVEAEAERQGIPTAGYIMIVTGVVGDADGTHGPRSVDGRAAS